ncbi:MAG: rhomboid family intramembrane serine protease [Dehalococcoidales bacterium]|nr:rhomboid family intramembrane serine protease [Dehalococcoidales bacterium]
MPAYFWAQPWTIVTSMFLHTRFWHIFANMITLYFFGTAFNRLVGDRRFLLVYFSGGIIGNILMLLLAGFAPYYVALGASGAVFALAGGLVVMRPKLPVIIFPIPIPVPLWVAVLGGFVILSFLPSVAWQAHLGGLIVGLIAGYIFRRKERYSFF